MNELTRKRCERNRLLECAFDISKILGLGGLAYFENCRPVRLKKTLKEGGHTRNTIEETTDYLLKSKKIALTKFGPVYFYIPR